MVIVTESVMKVVKLPELLGPVPPALAACTSEVKVVPGVNPASEAVSAVPTLVQLLPLLML